MKKTGCIFGFIAMALVISLPCYAQEWAMTYGGSQDERAYAMDQAADGGYIVAGTTSSFGAVGEDFWVVKLNPDGTVAWEKAFDMGYNERVFCVKQTTDGGYILGGTFCESSCTGWVLRLDAYGATVWQKTYWGSVYWIEQTADGGYVATGTIAGGYYDIMVLKLNADGSVAWKKSYGREQTDVGYCIKEIAGGGYIVAGYAVYANYLCILKLNATGTLVWQKLYNWQGLFENEAYSIQETFDQQGNLDGYIVAGDIGTYEEDSRDLLVVKLNLNGDIVWENTYGGAQDDLAYSVQQTRDQQGVADGYIVAGTTDSFDVGGTDIWLLKLNLEGSVVWQKTYGDSYPEGLLAGAVLQTQDGGYAVAGWHHEPGGSSDDLWVLKLNASGDIPGCSLIHDTTATPVPESAIPYYWALTETDFTPAPGDTFVTPLDTWATLARTCGTGPNLPPVLTPIGDQVVNEVESLQFTVSATDPGDVLTYSASNLPSGANFDPATRTFTWDPDQGQAGTYPDVVFTATDNGSPPLSDSEAITITVRPMLPIGGQQWAIGYGPDTGSTSTYGSVRPTFDPEGYPDGYIMAGSTDAGTGGFDIWLLKLDLQGNIAWENTYGGSANDEALSVEQTTDGGYIVLGKTSSFSGGIWILKLYPDGSVAWQKTYGGAGGENASSIQQTTDDGYIVAATTSSYGAGDTDIWILKLNPDGTVAWQSAYGSSGAEEAGSVRQTADGGYIVLGKNVDPGGGVRILKLDSSGGIDWQKAYQYGPWKYSLEETHDQQGNPDGYVAMGGGFTSQGRDDIAVAKLNLDGTIVWQRAYGGKDAESGLSIQQTDDGGYILAGHTFSFITWGNYPDIWVLKLNADGTVAWEKSYGTHYNIDFAGSIRQTWDGFVVGGYYHVPYGDSRIWGLKLNVYGEITGCSLWRNSQAIVTETSYTSADGDMAVQASSTAPVDTYAADEETSTQPSVVCFVSGPEPPVADFSAIPTSGVQPLQVTFTDLSSPTGEIDSWAWDFDADGTVDSYDESPAPWTYMEAGDYTVSLTVAGPGGQDTETKIAYIQVLEPPPPVAAFTADTTSGDKPLTVQFTDQSSGVVNSWAWNFGDGGSSMLENPSYTYTGAGDFTVTLTVTGPYGQDTEVKENYIHVTEPSGAAVIDKIGNRICYPAEKIRIIGTGFGQTPGDSLVHIANRTFDKDSPRIKYWSDTLIRIRIPNYKCAWFKGKDYKNPKVWVTVGGVDSNTKRLKVMKPATCP